MSWARACGGATNRSSRWTDRSACGADDATPARRLPGARGDPPGGGHRSPAALNRRETRLSGAAAPWSLPQFPGKTRKVNTCSLTGLED